MKTGGNGDVRLRYLCDVCPGEPLDHRVESERDWWSVVVDDKTGVAFGGWVCGGESIPRFDMAALLDAGFKP